MILIRYKTFLSVIVLFVGFSLVAFGQTKSRTDLIKVETNVQQASVTPVVFEHQNISCANLNASTDPRFNYIGTNFGLKLDFADPTGTYPFTSGQGREVIGPEDSAKTVTLSSGSATVFNWKTVGVTISAVIIKVGNDSYVYPYNPQADNDTNLATGDNRQISHVTFCFGYAPTAAESEIGGRVLDIRGRGIKNARIKLIDVYTGGEFYDLTNPFGYYSIGNLKAGKVYILMIAHKRYSFFDDPRVISLNEDATDINFIAMPQYKGNF